MRAHHLGLPKLPSASLPTTGTIWRLCSSGDEVTARQPKLPRGRELNHHRGWDAGMENTNYEKLNNSPLSPKKSHLNLLFSPALIICLLFLTNLVPHPHKLLSASPLLFLFFFFFHFLNSNLKKKKTKKPPLYSPPCTGHRLLLSVVTFKSLLSSSIRPEELQRKSC